MDMYKLKLTLDKKKFDTHLRAMKPELSEDVGRSTTRLDEDRDNFYIYIEAPDTVSLRASVSSLTRWLSIIDKIVEEVS